MSKALFLFLFIVGILFNPQLASACKPIKVSSTQPSCCCKKVKSNQKNKTTDSCCNKNKKEENSKKDCDGKCSDKSCNTSCSTFYFTPNNLLVFNVLENILISDNQNFIFSKSNPNTGYYSIWTPPNIA